MKLVTKDARCALLGAGLIDVFWTMAAQHFCHATNIRKPTGTTPWELRFHKPFTAAQIPFGATVVFRPAATTKERAVMTKAEPQTVGGILLTYELSTGCK